MGRGLEEELSSAKIKCNIILLFWKKGLPVETREKQFFNTPKKLQSIYFLLLFLLFVFDLSSTFKKNK